MKISFDCATYPFHLAFRASRVESSLNLFQSRFDDFSSRFQPAVKNGPRYFCHAFPACAARCAVRFYPDIAAGNVAFTFTFFLLVLFCHGVSSTRSTPHIAFLHCLPGFGCGIVNCFQKIHLYIPQTFYFPAAQNLFGIVKSLCGGWIYCGVLYLLYILYDGLSIFFPITFAT